MTNLSHMASFHSNERIAPSNRGIKHLDRHQARRKSPIFYVLALPGSLEGVFRVEYVDLAKRYRGSLRSKTIQNLRSVVNDNAKRERE
jgi:hypothetical protein